MRTADRRLKGYKGLPMEGIVARWYAQNRSSRSQIETWTRQAAQVTSALPDGADVLEVAPGPGYFAIEMARSGRVHVTALDISHTFVEIAAQNARQAGVPVVFREGDASSMPFGAGSFDLVICQAAFKNFSRPSAVLDEMYRVLRDGGTAVIEDMCKDTSAREIVREVRTMGLDPLNAFVTRQALGALRRRAYTREQFERLAAASAFRGCTIRTEGIGMEVRLTKPAAASAPVA
jgi:ubiquinone/menaquinone biosynthesis C-methylase UbiE